MNKPFNAADMIATVQKALAWKASLKIRPAMGMIIFGGVDPLCAAQGDQRDVCGSVYPRTNISEEQVKKVRRMRDAFAQHVGEGMEFAAETRDAGEIGIPGGGAECGRGYGN